MRGRNVSMEIKKGIRNSILLPTLMYGWETWTWNKAQQSKVHALVINYLRGECRATRWEGESKESMYGRYGRKTHANGVKWCSGMSEKKNLRWFGHILRKKNEKFVKYMSETEVLRRGRPVVRWKNRAKENMHDRRRGRDKALLPSDTQNMI